ncbi:long tail fiber protein distal subunit [Klebsiella phage iPHaGe-KPN-12i]|nr:long tail fiber protein distal subunit [Klebsiella phage iPHaGe-KPN-12i]
MADLKAGTTVGGNTIWSQANLPLLPSGNTITYKGYKVYTENDKPTKAEIGLGNVTNDAQVKKAGDEMTGDLTLKNNTQLTVPRRINLVADTAGNAGTAPYLLTTRSDNNAVTDPFPSQHTRTFTLFVNTKSNTSDPAGGANLAALLSHQATTGAGSIELQAYDAPNKTTGATGILRAQIGLNGWDGSINLSGASLNVGMSTTVSGNLTGTQLITKGDGNRNLFFQDSTGNELGLIYADTGKNVYVRSGGGSYASRFASDGTLILANHLTVPGLSTFTGQATFNGRMNVGADYATQGANTSILRVDTSGDGNAVGDGATHFGYKDGVGKYHHYFRGTGMTNINTKGGLAVNVQSFYNDVPAGTPSQVFLSNAANGTKNYIRQFRGGTGDVIWHETVQGNTYRIATGSTDEQEELSISSTGYLRARAEVQSTFTGGGGQFRAVAGNYGFFIRNDGANTYFLLTNSGDPYGGWNGHRPFQVDNSNGQVTVGSQGLVVPGSARFNSGLGCGTRNGLGGNAICLGDDDTGFRQEGDGYLDAYSNSQRIMRWTANDGGSAQSYKRFYVQNTDGPALVLNGPAINSSCYMLIQKAGNNGMYIGFGGADEEVTMHNYRLNTAIVLRAGDTYMNRGLYIEGNANFNDVYIRSDIRLKSNLVELKDSLRKVEQLKGYIYDKQSKDADDIVYHRESGLIAQDVEKVLPEAVREDRDTGMLTISPSAINALLVNAINEIRERLEVIENKLGA